MAQASKWLRTSVKRKWQRSVNPTNPTMIASSAGLGYSARCIMAKWIKAHKIGFIGICLFVYILATAIPIGVSYGVLNMDFRPFILLTDVIAAMCAIACWLVEAG